MSLEKTSEISKIEVMNNKVINLVENVNVTENGSLISSSKLQKTIVPGQDYSGESLEVRRVCAAVHTAEAITNYRNSL